MPELLELSSADAVRSFIRQNAATGGCVVTFSAHWCGPCKASKPALEALAREQAAGTMAIAYESDLGDALQEFRVRAFPTYILFDGRQQEAGRVEGANLERVRSELLARIVAGSAMPETGGETLGGGGGAAGAPLSPEAARAVRLAKLASAATPAAAEPAAAPMETDEPKEKKQAAAAAAEDEPPKKDADGDTEMNDSAATAKTDAAAAKDEEEEEVSMEDPCAKLDPELLKTLTESMGFSQLRAQKGLLYGNGGTVEGAVEWLMQHQDDVDIDEPVAAVKAQSYKCNDCGKILSNMANLELHANKTGHSDFEESTVRVQPLTEEEKAAKIAEIKQLLKAKRAEREEAEKVDHTEREKQRREMGKQMAKTKEQLDIEQRKREAYLRKKEKQEFLKERQRLREELARDKAERAAQKGKLSSKLGVEGYKPDGIQYDGPGGEEGAPDSPQQQAKPKKVKADASKIDEYISKVSSYKAGGDGGKCLKVLKAYVGNAADKPEEEKFKTINMENKVFKIKVKPFLGAKNLLMACGFQPNEGGDALVLSEDADLQVLTDTKAKLEAALVSYG